VSLRMLTNLRLPDLRLTPAQQRTTGQDLPSDLYYTHIPCIPCRVKNFNFSILSADSVLHPNPYPMGTGGTFTGGKGAEA
jgi:hypothetical protein